MHLYERFFENIQFCLADRIVSRVVEDKTQLLHIWDVKPDKIKRYLEYDPCVGRGAFGGVDNTGINKKALPFQQAEGGGLDCDVYRTLYHIYNFYCVAVGTVMMVSRIFDGVSDIIMGILVDRTKSRFGKARPWLLRMCVPFAVSGVLLFSVPTSWSAAPKLVYVFITYNLVSTVIYTAINVPYSALNALMTQDPYERSVLSIFRNLLATAGTLTVNLCTLPLVEYFGDNASAWTKTFCVLGLLAVVAFLINFFGTKERVRPSGTVQDKDAGQAAADVPIMTGIKALFQNKYWIMMTGMLALFFLMYSVNGGATVYYAKDILGDRNLVSTINGIFNIVQIAGMFFIGWYWRNG